MAPNCLEGPVAVHEGQKLQILEFELEDEHSDVLALALELGFHIVVLRGQYSQVLVLEQGHRNRIITCIHGRYVLPYGHCGTTLPALRRMPSPSYMHSTRWAMLRDCYIATRSSLAASVRVKDEKLVHVLLPLDRSC